MGVPAQAATSWNHLQDLLYAESWREEMGRFRSPFAFRGCGEASEGLSTPLARLGGHAREIEGHLLRNFRKYASREGRWEDSAWSWLALARHHGLPTRLLDWTYSPFVALHFATAATTLYERDAVVWCVDYTRTNRLLPRELRRLLEHEGSDVFTAELLGRAAASLRELDAMGGEFVLYFEPPSLDDRIVNQFALFSLMSDPLARLDQWLERHPETCRRIVVPAALKWEVRDKLDQAGVTERVLFPGLDGLSRWLTRYYAPRG